MTPESLNLRVMFVEDSEIDVELSLRVMNRNSIIVEYVRVDGKQDMAQGLLDFAPQLIVSDFSMPRFSGEEALALATEVAPNVPFIFVSGTVGEERAIDLLRRGATDYVVKDRLERLGPAIRRATKEREEKAAREHAEQRLRDSETLLRAVLKTLPVGVWVVDKSATLVMHNPASTRIWEGRRHAGIAGNADLPARWVETMAEVATEDFPIQVALRAGEASHNQLIDFDFGEERHKIVRVSAVPLRVEDRTIAGAIAVHEDITELFAQENALRESQEQFRIAFAHAAVGMSIADGSGALLGANPAFCEMTGFSEEELLALSVTNITHPDDQAETARLHAELRANVRDSFVINKRYRRPDGRYVWAQASVSAVRDKDGNVVSTIGIAENITERMHAEATLLLRERALESSANGVAIVNCSTQRYPIEYVNPAFGYMTGYSVAEVLGADFTMLLGKDASQPGVEKLRQAMENCQDARAVVRATRRDGLVYWSEFSIAPVRAPSGAVTHFVAVMVDVSEGRKYQEQLEHQATHDALTGLANRSLLHDRIEQALTRAQRNGTIVAVTYIDLDQFKFVNDSLGHDVGDQLIREVGERLTHAIRNGDTVARIGGDEFVVVLTDSDSENDIMVAIVRIQDAMLESFVINELPVTVTASIGVSIYPKDASHRSQLLRNADMAMYRAKEEGRNNAQFYTRELNARVQERVFVERNMRAALERDEFRLYYQPQIQVASDRIVGAEALIRWEHPTRGLIPPAQFIGIAEETDLIVELGRWVIDTACKQWRAWQDAGLSPPMLAVNLAARQLKDPSLRDTVFACMYKYAVPASALGLEITESQIMDNPDQVSSLLEEFRSAGLHVAIDDFGTGYSSLAYLKRLPVSTLKIDKSFVRDLETSAGDAAIAKAIISLAHSLGMDVVAEGVECEHQVEFMRLNGCDVIQGYFYGKPMPALDFSRLLADRK
jgi:diguanylate cyclase (GGDEF)-like protein/PAS domain S-box-containing protein